MAYAVFALVVAFTAIPVGVAVVGIWLASQVFSGALLGVVGTAWSLAVAVGTLVLLARAFPVEAE